MGSGLDNNIHIVSNDGKIIRILEGVQNPTCIKFLRGSYRFLVGECGGRVKVFELEKVRYYNIGISYKSITVIFKFILFKF